MISGREPVFVVPVPTPGPGPGRHPLVLDLQVSMLPSINQKFRVNTQATSGRRLYIPKEYQEAMKLTRQDAQYQVANARWQVAPTDHYSIVAILPTLCRKKPTRTDTHNPWKPMVDELVKAGVLFDDSLIEQEMLTRRWTTDPTQVFAAIRIYRFVDESPPLAPFQQLFDRWLTYWYNER